MSPKRKHLVIRCSNFMCCHNQVCYVVSMEFVSNEHKILIKSLEIMKSKQQPYYFQCFIE